jgi:hypothetical protein
MNLFMVAGLEDLLFLIENHGFALVFAAIALITGVWYIKRLARNMESANKQLIDTVVGALQHAEERLQFKDKLIGNHITHLTSAVNETNVRIERYSAEAVSGVGLVVEAIHGLTEMMRTLLTRKCPLLNGTPEDKEEK